MDTEDLICHTFDLKERSGPSNLISTGPYHNTTFELNQSENVWIQTYVLMYIFLKEAKQVKFSPLDIEQIW